MYTLPSSLLEHIRTQVLRGPFAHRHVVLQKSSIPLEKIGDMEAFIFWLSRRPDESYETVSRRDIVFYNSRGDQVGFCLEAGHFMTTWRAGENYKEGGETVADALARLDDEVVFAMVTFHNAKGLQSVQVYKAGIAAKSAVAVAV